jgi:hypothetical protein
MIVRSILWSRSSRSERFIHGLRTLDRVWRLWHVWFGWMFLHGSYACNKPALEGCD